MEWEKEIYCVDSKCSVHRLKFIGTLPECDKMALYYSSIEKVTRVVNTEYKTDEEAFPTLRVEQSTYVDRMEAYEHAKTKLGKMKKQIDERIEQCNNRKWGYCITTIDGETKEHEIDERGW